MSRSDGLGEKTTTPHDRHSNTDSSNSPRPGAHVLKKKSRRSFSQRAASASAGDLGGVAPVGRALEHPPAFRAAGGTRRDRVHDL